MDGLYIIHYYYPGTDPWKNIMALPEEQVSFTTGDSCAQIINGMNPEVLTKEMLMKRIADCGNSLDTFLKSSLGRFAYVEVQLWYRPTET